MWYSKRGSDCRDYWVKDCVFSRCPVSPPPLVRNPKVLHVLWSSPCFTSTHLCDFNDFLRDILRDFINVTLEPWPAWLQASLPVRAGGIGVRSAAQLAPSAYLASAAGCVNLVQQIFPPLATRHYQPLRRLCLNHLELGPQSSSPHSSYQPTPVGLGYPQGGGPPADSLGILKWLESGAWLIALPVASLDLRLDNEVVRIAVGLRLSLPLCRPH